MGWGAPQQPSPSDPRQILMSAFAAQQEGRNEDAVRGYSEFLKRFPDVADVYINMGAALVQLGRVGEAIESYERARGLGNATNPGALELNLALAYYKTGRLVPAAEELSKALRREPANLKVGLLLADCHMQRGDYPSVVATLRPFEDAHSNDRALIYLLGTALIRSGDEAAGQQLVDRILRQGDSAEARLMLGTARMEVRDVQGALEEFQKALELNPDLPGANAFVSRALRQMGRVDEALVHSRRELELNPNDYESHLHVGVFLYKREQDYEGALRHFDRCLSLRPGALEARFQVALVYVLQNRTEEALKIVEDVVREAPDFLEGHVTLTSLYFRLRRREDAERHRAIVERLRSEQDEKNVKQVVPETNEPAQPEGERP